MSCKPASMRIAPGKKKDAYDIFGRFLALNSLPHANEYVMKARGVFPEDAIMRANPGISRRQPLCGAPWDYRKRTRRRSDRAESLSQTVPGRLSMPTCDITRIADETVQASWMIVAVAHLLGAPAWRRRRSGAVGGRAIVPLGSEFVRCRRCRGRAPCSASARRLHHSRSPSALCDLARFAGAADFPERHRHRRARR